MSTEKSFLVKLGIFHSFQMAVSCLLSFYAGLEFSLLFKNNALVSALWCQISTIIVFHPQLKESLELGFYNVLGNVLGAFLFFTFHLFLESRQLSFIFTIFTSIAISNAIGHKQLITFAVMTSTIILAVSKIDPSSSILVDAYGRVIESFIGSLIAIIVQYITISLSDLLTFKIKN